MREVVNTATSKCPDSRGWKELCQAALSELDANKLPERIAQAEKAIMTRARELVPDAGNNIEEEQALDDAMFSLHALRSTLKCSPTQRTRDFEHLKTA